jgi:hypothetical protein
VESAQSLRSLDSVGTMEVMTIVNIRHPPKNLLLAASACMILLSPGHEVGTRSMYCGGRHFYFVLFCFVLQFFLGCSKILLSDTS